MDISFHLYNNCEVGQSVILMFQMQTPRFVDGKLSCNLAKTSIEAELPHTRDHVIRYYRKLLSLTLTAQLRPYTPV